MNLVNQPELAHDLDVSKQYINKLVKKGVLRPRKDGKLDREKSVEIVRNLKSKGSNGNGNESGNDSKPTLWEEQARLAGHKADIAEMESRKLARELVEVDLVVAEFSKLVFAVRQRLLGLGSRLAPQLSKKPPAFIKRKLDTAIDEVLNEFGKYNAETGECGPAEPARKNRKSGAGFKAKGPANRKPVGKQI